MSDLSIIDKYKTISELLVRLHRLENRITVLEKDNLLLVRENADLRERIDLIERFVGLFGKDCIECLVADREFVGEKWISYLNRVQIRYHIRTRNNFKVYLPPEREGK
ncbi:hypothetical protein MNBD_BACTEROID03-2584 [hydrothermal vent metagenome]|uniref:Uncharacterized protein n=1 Tax=hydrothermal vent metagenome TaxID=652676 RepID=A0A3B0TZ40_9ZZZZ